MSSKDNRKRARAPQDLCDQICGKPGKIRKINSIKSSCYLRGDSLTDTPFYIPGGKAKENCLSSIPPAHKILDSVQKIIDAYNMPSEWIDLFKHIHTDTAEISWHNWTFISAKQIDTISVSYKQKHWIDIAIMYAGLGWLYVLCWDKDIQKFFIILTGGSNYYDCYDNQLYFKDNVDTLRGFCSKDLINNEKMMTFDQVCNLVSKNDETDVRKLAFTCL